MNKFKKIFIFGIGSILLVSSFILVSCKKGEEGKTEAKLIARKKTVEREILYYTCGMHPSVRVSPEDYEKGNTKCPICNMDLVPVLKEEKGGMDKALLPGRGKAGGQELHTGGDP